MKKDKFNILSIILFGLLLFMVGCSIEPTDEDNNIKIIEAVLTNTFTGPNEELAKTYKEVKSDDLDVAESAFDERESYYQSNLMSYFTEDYYDEVMKTGLVSAFHQEALRNDIQMKVEDISVEQNKNADTSYDFVVNVLFKQGEDELKFFEIYGIVGINENDKIFRIIHHNANDFFKEMKTT